MLISEIESTIQDVGFKGFYAMQLFSVKRMWGPQCKFGMVDGESTTQYGTIQELIDDGLCVQELSFLDPYFQKLPTITEFPYDSLDISPDNQSPSLPESPVDTANRLANEATDRASYKRQMNR